MRITAYRTSKFQNISTYHTDYIISQEPPSIITDEQRELARNGIMPMCCFHDKESDSWHFIPWEFVIRIDDNDNKTDETPW